MKIIAICIEEIKFRGYTFESEKIYKTKVIQDSKNGKIDSVGVICVNNNGEEDIIHYFNITDPRFCFVVNPNITIETFFSHRIES